MLDSADFRYPEKLPFRLPPTPKDLLERGHGWIAYAFHLYLQIEPTSKYRRLLTFSTVFI
jgi:hypothetical protein